MTLYRSIFKQAFVAAWQHKYLWFFGLFATLLASNFELELVNRFLNRESTLFAWQRWTDTGIFTMQAWRNLGELARVDSASFISLIIFVLILLALLIALIWISIVSQVALVSNTNKAIGSGRSSVAERRHDTSIGFQEGRRYFWPALAINTIVRIIVYALAALTLLPALFRSAPGLIDNIVFLLFFVFFLSIALSLALIAKYALAALIITRQPLGEAIRSGWQLYWSNWLLSLEMAFILFGMSLLASLVIIIAVLVVAIPFALLYMLALAFTTLWVYVACIILGVIVSFALVIIGGSIITVVQTTAWVALYNQLTGKVPLSSKLERTLGSK